MSSLVTTVTTVWQLVCPVTAANGLVASTTQLLPPNFTPTSTYEALVLRTAIPPMSVVDGSAIATITGTILPPDTYGGLDGPKLAIAVPLHTTLIVDVFPNPVPSPIYSYRPAWGATDDGSLISGVYRQATNSDHGRIILMGFLLAIFVRNVLVSIDYLRRGRSRDKTLFYLLLASQLWGPVAFIAIIVGILSPTASCTAINVLTLIAMESSSSLLVTGILGIKAYRCLNRSKFVLLVTGALQIASIVLFVLDLTITTSVRAFNGTCSVKTGTSSFIPAWISVMFSETGFLSLCFLFAVWRSSSSSAAQGRMSLAASYDGSREIPQLDMIEEKDGRRGWWDYVPPAPRQPGDTDSMIGPLDRVSTRGSDSNLLDHAEPSSSHAPPKADGLASSLKKVLWQAKSNSESQHSAVASSVPWSASYSLQPPGSSAPPPRDRARSTVPALASSPFLRSQIIRKLSMPRTPIDSMESKWSKRLPNMLRVVIRNELFYTAAVTLSCCFSAIAVSSAAQTNVLFSPLVWLQINWAVTSLLVMQSYAKVVERHQREKLLEEPVLAAAQMGGTFIRDRILQPSLSVLNNRRPALRRYSYDGERATSLSSFGSLGGVRELRNPFADSQDDLVSIEGRKSSFRSDVATENGKPRSVVIDIEPSSPEDPVSTQNFRQSTASSALDPELSLGVSSSTNIRSPTSASFPHSVNDGGSGGPGFEGSLNGGRVVRRQKSHDWR